MIETTAKLEGSAWQPERDRAESPHHDTEEEWMRESGRPGWRASEAIGELLASDRGDSMAQRASKPSPFLRHRGLLCASPRE